MLGLIKNNSKAITIALVLVNILLCCWYILHGDIFFGTDVARDFFLYQEIALKKVILIGPRSSTAGLFHGPLWAYLNFPAYVLGKGNPLVLGWYWIGLTVLFLGSSYYVAKNLFNKETGYLYVILLSQLMIFQTKGLFNPHGALFFMPLFFYFFIKYIQSSKIMYLLLHLFVAGLIIQFQMAIGLPLLFLSGIALLYYIVKKKKFIHVLSFFILLIPLSTFLFFDLRHDGLMLKAATSFASPESGSGTYNYLSQVSGRVKLLLSGLQINHFTLLLEDAVNVVIFCIMMAFCYLQIKKNKYKEIYVSFLYFYFGYMVLSFINKGPLLYHQFFPLFSLTALLFVSFITSSYKKKFLVIFVIIYCLNMVGVVRYLQSSRDFIGKHFESWKFLTKVVDTAYGSTDNSFGVFVYTPDIVGYGPKYAATYYKKTSPKDSSYFEKKPVTYLLIEPPPADRPGISVDWWKENKLRLTKKPVKVVSFPNGYKVEKYTLTKEEIDNAPAEDVDIGLHYR